jgi:ABC-type Mn2+/Zn2+ transport system ATPase subunit
MSAGEAVRAEGLVVGYAGRPVVSGISLSLPAGALLAVLGTNGSGKSTLVKTIVGLIPPVAGTLHVLRGAPGAAPERVAYLGQAHAIDFALPLRTVDVVTMGRFPARGLWRRMGADDRRLVERSMARMGIASLADEPLARLSGGQRQRVHIARALAWRADLLVLDEPTAGLDVSGRDLLQTAIDEERARGVAVVTCTHDIADALGADLALLLAGRVVASGPPARVLTREALMETFGLVLTQLPGGPELAMDPVHRHDAHEQVGPDGGR